MWRNAVACSGIVYLLLSSGVVHAAPAPNVFNAYPASDTSAPDTSAPGTSALGTWTGPSATPQLTSPFLASYAGLLRAAAQRPANFAGHYRLETWRAFNGCFRGAAIDLKTGAVSFLPLTLCGGRGRLPSYAAAFRRDSTLVSLADPNAGSGRPVTRYFALDGSAFADVTQAVAKARPGLSPDPSEARTPDARSAEDRTGSLGAPPRKLAGLPPDDQRRLPQKPRDNAQSLAFNACGSTWGYFIDATHKADVSLVLEGAGKGPTLVVHVRDGATTSELTGVRDRGPWNLDLTVPAFGQEAMSRIIYSGHLIFVSLSFVQSGNGNKLVLKTFGFSDTGKPCPPTPKATVENPAAH